MYGLLNWLNECSDIRPAKPSKSDSDEDGPSVLALACANVAGVGIVGSGKLALACANVAGAVVVGSGKLALACANVAGAVVGASGQVAPADGHVRVGVW